MEGYNCPNCGAPIGYTDKCDYCGTLLDWHPYVRHIVPLYHYHKVYEASAGCEIHEDWTNNPDMAEEVRAGLCNKLGEQISRNINIKEDRVRYSPFVRFRADIKWVDMNEREKE
jgi:hypothetical protein